MIKLQFFNQTWLKNENVPEIQSLKPEENELEVSSTFPDDAVEENDEVPAVDSTKEEMAVDPNLEFKEVKTEPVFSTKEKIEAFNDWYYEKIAEKETPKKPKPSLSRTKAETLMLKSTSTKQVMTDTSPTMMKVDMYAVIVMMIALIKMKLVSVPAAASPTVTPTSCSVCRTCLCAVSAIKTNQSLSELIKSQGFCGSNRNSCLAGQRLVQV